MDCFWCEISVGTLVAKEAQETRWLSANELNDVPWLPADLEIIPKIRSSMNS
jgi:8-oxo-dGTP diphosphatase